LEEQLQKLIIRATDETKNIEPRIESLKEVLKKIEEEEKEKKKFIK